MSFEKLGCSCEVEFYIVSIGDTGPDTLRLIVSPDCTAGHGLQRLAVKTVADALVGHEVKYAWGVGVDKYTFTVGVEAAEGLARTVVDRFGPDMRLLEARELELRKEWWLNHGHLSEALYGDDGEMQCNQIGCITDFKRESLEELRTKVYRFRLEAATKVQKKTSAGVTNSMLERLSEIRAVFEDRRYRGTQPGGYPYVYDLRIELADAYSVQIDNCLG